MSENSGCGCGKIFGFGCALVLVLGIIGALALVFNFDNIRDSEFGQRVVQAAGEAREIIEEAIALSEEVSDEFPMDHCSINLSNRVSGGETRTTLELTLVNPQVPEGLDEDAYALEVARFAAERFSRIGDVELVQIGLQSKSEGGIGVSKTETHRFATDELLEPLPAEAVGAAEGAMVEESLSATGE